MEIQSTTFFHAKNLQQFLYYRKTVNQIQVVGNCTQIKEMPSNVVSTSSIPELRLINKHERFIDIGPAVTLSEILDLGKNNIPEVLFKSILTIGTPYVRNLATIGGNLFNKDYKSTLYSTLLAMNAIIELKSEDSTKLIKLTNFEKIPEKFVVTKIRLPIEEWDSQFFLRYGKDYTLDDHSASYTSLIKTEKNVISDIRIVFAGPIAYRFNTIENNLLGVKLPLSKGQIFPLVEENISVFSEQLNGIRNKEEFQVITKNALLQTLLNIC